MGESLFLLGLGKFFLDWRMAVEGTAWSKSKTGRQNRKAKSKSKTDTNTEERSFRQKRPSG